MSFDRRLRGELKRDAAAIEPDVERQLGVVEARARRRGGIGPSAVLVAAAIIVAAVILRLPDRPDAGPGGGPSPSGFASSGPSGSGNVPVPSPSTPASYPEIAGTYQATLDGANSAVAQDALAGMWTMRLEPNGTVLLSPPATFLPGASGLSGVAFSLTGDRFRTNLFYNDYCNSIGNYVWSHGSGRLTFTSVDDTCAIRRTLLVTTPWLPTP
jgi:hypothetical protein